MKDSDALLRAQINALIQDEIQENINEYVDEKEKVKDSSFGFAAQTMDSKFAEEEGAEKELKVNIPNLEVDKLIKEYKKLKRKQKSNLSEIKKLGLVNKHGKPLGGEDVKH